MLVALNVAFTAQPQVPGRGTIEAPNVLARWFTSRLGVDDPCLVEGEVLMPTPTRVAQRGGEGLARRVRGSLDEATDRVRGPRAAGQAQQGDDGPLRLSSVHVDETIGDVLRLSASKAESPKTPQNTAQTPAPAFPGLDGVLRGIFTPPQAAKSRQTGWKRAVLEAGWKRIRAPLHIISNQRSSDRSWRYARGRALTLRARWQGSMTRATSVGPGWLRSSASDGAG